MSSLHASYRFWLELVLLYTFFLYKYAVPLIANLTPLALPQQNATSFVLWRTPLALNMQSVISHEVETKHEALDYDPTTTTATKWIQHVCHKNRATKKLLIIITPTPSSCTPTCVDTDDVSGTVILFILSNHVSELDPFFSKHFQQLRD